MGTGTDSSNLSIKYNSKPNLYIAEQKIKMSKIKLDTRKPKNV